MKTEFEDFMGNFAGGKKVARRIAAASPMRRQIAGQRQAIKAARMEAKMQKQQLREQQMANAAAQQAIDPTLDPNYDPSLDPNYDPNLDPNAIYDPNDPNAGYDPNSYYDPNDPYYSPTYQTNAIPPVQTNLLTSSQLPRNPFFKSYGEPNMNPQFFAKGGKKSKKITNISTRTGLGGKAVRSIIEEFNKNSAQIFANQQEMKKIDNEMAKAQDQADAQRAQLEATMSIAQSAIDVAGAAGAAGAGGGDAGLVDYLVADGAQPSYVPTMVGDDMSELLADENFMEYDEYLSDEFDEYDDDEYGDEYDEYDDDEYGEEYDEYDDDEYGEEYDEYDEDEYGEEYDEYDDDDFDEYDEDYDEYDEDEFLGAARRRKRGGRGGGGGGDMRKANRQARRANRQSRRQARRASRQDLRQQRQLMRKQKLLMKAGRKKAGQQRKLLKRQKQLINKQKKVASRRQKLRKIMQADPNIRSAVMRGEDTCSLFNKLNACALPPSLWRWRDCGMNLAPRQKMVADKFNTLTYGEYDGVDDNVFDCSCNQ